MCVCCAALAAGLTMGLVSLEAFDLRIKERSGTDQEKRLAKKLLPLVTNTPHHQLLVTLLLCNSVANEALPLFLDKLVPEWCAIIVSVVFVLVFGEILPSAVFTGPAKLRMAAMFSNMVWCLMFILKPIAYPIACILDHYIPEETEFMSRGEVRAMIEIQREVAIKEGHGEPFNEDEEDMIKVRAAQTVRDGVDCGTRSMSCRVCNDDKQTHL